MMKSRLFFAALMATASLVMPRPASADVGVGDDAPAFRLVGSDGKTYTNEDFEGKKVVVIAWYPKAFTGG